MTVSSLPKTVFIFEKYPNKIFQKIDYIREKYHLYNVFGYGFYCLSTTHIAIEL